MLSAEATYVLAVAVLCLLGAVLGGLVIRWFRHPHYTPAQRICYFYGEVMARVLWRAEVVGHIGLPPGQGAVIVCNHRGPYDPAFVQIVANRVVHWMVAREYCRHPVLSAFLRTAGCIPVSRGGVDTAATKAAIRYVLAGDLVGLFPEGRINTTRRPLLPGRPGAALIAIKARRPIIPCYLTGSPAAGSIVRSMFTPARARLIIGAPMDISPFYGREKDRQAMEELTLALLKRIAHLAGCADFEPQLAGRRWKPGE